MKIQDIGFCIILAILLTLRKERWFVYAGLMSLTIAIPLFAKWVFFSAERLTWYAAAFFTIAVLSLLFTRRQTV
ncbi:hypothetical protein A2Z00_02320 [Candidatus Gottesmanbacteria bacterium RBG_13_45_10]|uniref:Uncharacterized protein n=1 Tax=Candidatus Gottesmanbacteria bacterium RBG_13_45_10 TaxID=1798370 RepID=A0A1F5ZG25_9BACT|nr:MAG: hypothetical protein A2Z00_02320 [Candidatus Gottesmanbacteria bacterium RBG_13_45_10]